MTRFLSLALALLLGLSVVASVWRPATSKDGKTPLVWLTGSNPARSAQIKTFNDEHRQLGLSQDLGDGSTQKVILQCSSGVGPDLFDVLDGDQLQTYADAGVLWDLTGPARAGHFSVDGDLWPVGRTEVTDGNRQYAYPCNIGTSLLFYNKNVFDHFGVPYPENGLTWEQFLEVATRVNSPDAADPGGRIYAVTGLDWQTLFEGMNGQCFADDGTPAVAHSPELKRSLEMYRDFIFEHRVMPSELDMKSMSGQGGWGSGGLNQFAAGRFAMLVTGEWAFIGLKHAYEQQVQELRGKDLPPGDAAEPLERPLRLGCVLLPHFAGRPPCYRVRSRSAAINVRSPHREEALMFLQYLAGDSYSALINEAADSLPGNPAYVDAGLRPEAPDLSRPEIHRASKEAMDHAYVPRRSPFVRSEDTRNILLDQVRRLESDPSLNIDELLSVADREINRAVQRNLEHDPNLRRLYDERTGRKPVGNVETGLSPGP